MGVCTRNPQPPLPFPHPPASSASPAPAQVTFQFAYTTLFGWLATFLFLRTGHLAAPLAAHVFCNWAGFPPFGEMWEHPRAIVLLLTTAGGLVTFVLQLGRMTAPSRYGNEVYGAGW